MANEPNWHKQVAIATWIVAFLTCVLIFLGVMSWVYPPDPAHPVRFEFLSKSIVVPFWMAGAVLLIFCILAIDNFRRRRSTKATRITNLVNNQEMPGPRIRLGDLEPHVAAKSRISESLIPTSPADAKTKATATAEPFFTWDATCSRILFKWPEGLSAEVRRHESQACGLLRSEAR